jgi:cellulose 1,4-beta-cellobiosidase
MYGKLAAVAAFLSLAKAQQACSLTTETHPALSWQRCTSSSCTDVRASVVLDANWRWTHTVAGSDNCYDGNLWDESICTSNSVCAQKCCVDGADYSGTYGVTTSGSQLNLKFVTKHSFGNTIGSRVYLMEPGSTTKYQTFNLLNNEFTFDVDVSKLPCGLNGALYFVAMDADGGLATQPNNKAGAKYGTGYCDSQCPRDVKFIGGEANVDGWNPTEGNPDSGVGELGACCAEMDIWEANSISTAYTPHPCENSAFHVCYGDDCGGTYSADRYAGDCDPDGCDFNAWRQGNKTYYGPGSNFKINTNQKVTVVTQFLTSGGTLSEIKRFYVQNGVVFANAQDLLASGGNSITQAWCDNVRQVFDDLDSFKDKGGLAQMGRGLTDMVLVLSLWNDFYSNMLWLDSQYPPGEDKLGVDRGSCPTDSGKFEDMVANHADASVAFSNIKFGPIGSTFNSGGTNPPTSTTTRTSTTSTRTSSTSTRTSTTSTRTSSVPGPSPSTVPAWGQCGGNQHTGSTTCVSGYCCRRQSEWYSQCIPC